MDNERFKPILAQKLGALFSETIEELEAEELKKITPVAELAVELCPEEDRQRAREIIRQRIVETKKEILYRRSPVLREAEAVIRCNHDAMVKEASERIERHRDAIGRELLGGCGFTGVTGIYGHGADVHNHGRLTLTVETPQGKFLYKPHSCKTDCAVFALVEKHFSDVMRVPKSLDFGDYGFCEYIENRPAVGRTRAAEYYCHFGGVTALLHALGGTDFHCENFLASGVYPVPVDLETILTPMLKNVSLWGEDTGFPVDYSYSVSSSGLLPKLVGGVQFSPLISRDARNAGAPTADGQIQTVLDYKEAFFAGFDRIYDRCIALKEELSDAVRQLSDVPIRRLIRNTDYYVKLLCRLNSPGAAQDHTGQERVLKGSSRYFEENGLSSLLLMAEAEKESLFERDIPYFYTLGGSCDLYSNGRLVAEDFFETSALDHALCRIERLSPAEKAFEKGILSHALDSALIKSNTRKPIPDCRGALPMGRDEALDLAGRLLRQVYDASIAAPCGKRGLVGHTGEGDTFSYLQLPLATGLSGIALFASAAAGLDGSLCNMAEVLTEIAEDSLEAALRALTMWEELPPAMRDMGLATGAGGIITLLRQRNSPCSLSKSCLAALCELLHRAPIEMCGCADLYSGLAGLILALYRVRGEADVTPHVRRAADRILELKTLAWGDRLLWKGASVNRAISGYGHGCGGIGLALLLAWEMTGETAYRAAAEDAYAFEHEIYQEKLGTWPDLRSSPVPDGNMYGICSGAPGMALCMKYGKAAGMPFAGIDLQRASEAISRQPLLYRDTLCCGNASAVEALLALGETDRAAALLGKMRDKADILGDYCYTASSYQPFYAPSLFYGGAGLGYTLLRYADPSRVFSIFL